MVRYGIIGLGNMGRTHVNRFVNGEIKGGELTAVCDIREDRLAWLDRNGVTEPARFDNAEKLIESGLVDAVLIAVPHYDHPTIAKAAFEKGINVLTEKPAGVYTKQVREMNEAAEKSGKVFGIMCNQRTNPLYKKVREMVRGGELGTIKRAVWIITDWYRSQAYHNSSDWRSTWGKEGGGALINQCPHQLDLWWWILGMPERVRSFVGFGKHYDIEVEDDVTAYMEYENGATGLFVTCTAEVPGTNRLEISGSRGRIVVEDDKLMFDRCVVDEREFNKNNTIPFGKPEVWKCEIPIDYSLNTQHTGILQNFTNAVENGDELIAPGKEGIFGLTISNAIHMSAWSDDWVYPKTLDEDLFYNMLDEKIKNSKFVKHTVESTAKLTW